METPSQATLRSTAPPTATPSQATTNAATAPPPPADYKPVDGESKRTQKLILIICFKLLCLVICIISIAVGIPSVTESTAYQATLADKYNCEHKKCGGYDDDSSSYDSYGYLNQYRTETKKKSSFCNLFSGQLPTPGWISKFEWFKGLAIFAVLLGFLLLSIYGCWYASSGCNKAWPVDFVFQLILALLIGAAGILLLLSILDVTGRGKKPFPPTCESRFTENSYDVSPSSSNINGTKVSQGKLPDDAEIKRMTSFDGVMAAAVLAILDAILFVVCAVFIFVFHPKEPPPEPPQPAQQQVVVVQQPLQPQQPVMQYQQPMMYQQQPMVYQQQPSQMYMAQQQPQQPMVYAQPQPAYY